MSRRIIWFALAWCLNATALDEYFCRCDIPELNESGETFLAEHIDRWEIRARALGQERVEFVNGYTCSKKIYGIPEVEGVTATVDYRAHSSESGFSSWLDERECSVESGQVVCAPALPDCGFLTPDRTPGVKHFPLREFVENADPAPINLGDQQYQVKYLCNLPDTTTSWAPYDRANIAGHELQFRTYGSNDEWQSLVYYGNQSCEGTFTHSVDFPVQEVRYAVFDQEGNYTEFTEPNRNNAQGSGLVALGGAKFDFGDPVPVTVNNVQSETLDFSTESDVTISNYNIGAGTPDQRKLNVEVQLEDSDASVDEVRLGGPTGDLLSLVTDGTNNAFVSEGINEGSLYELNDADIGVGAQIKDIYVKFTAETSNASVVAYWLDGVDQGNALQVTSDSQSGTGHTSISDTLNGIAEDSIVIALGGSGDTNAFMADGDQTTLASVASGSSIAAVGYEIPGAGNHTQGFTFTSSRRPNIILVEYAAASGGTTHEVSASEDIGLDSAESVSWAIEADSAEALGLASVDTVLQVSEVARVEPAVVTSSESAGHAAEVDCVESAVVSSYETCLISADLSAAESISVGEANSVTAVFSADITVALAVTSNEDVAAVFESTLAESAGFNSVEEVAHTAAVSTGESISIASVETGAVGASTIDVDVAETIAAASVEAVQQVAVVDDAESISVGSVDSAVQVVAASSAEALVVSESNSASRIIAAAIVESLTANDSSTILVTIDGVISESIGLAGIESAQISHSVDSVFGLAITEAFLAQAIVEAGLTESVSITEVNTDAGVVFDITTPSGRTCRVIGQGRTVVVENGSRTVKL